MQHGDRFFLSASAAHIEVGTYSLGYKLALAVGTFSLSPLYMVWGARMYAAAGKRGNSPVVFGQVFTRMPGRVRVCRPEIQLFQDEIVHLIGGVNYANAAQVIAPVVLAGFFQTASSLMDAGFYIRRRTTLKLRLALEATAVMLVLYAALIPPFRGLGAALATLGGFAYLAFRTWQTSQRIFFVRYEWQRVSACLALALGLWTLSPLLPFTGGGAFASGTFCWCAGQHWYVISAC